MVEIKRVVWGQEVLRRWGVASKVRVVPALSPGSVVTTLDLPGAHRHTRKKLQHFVLACFPKSSRLNCLLALLSPGWAALV